MWNKDGENEKMSGTLSKDFLLILVWKNNIEPNNTSVSIIGSWKCSNFKSSHLRFQIDHGTNGLGWSHF